MPPKRKNKPQKVNLNDFLSNEGNPHSLTQQYFTLPYSFSFSFLKGLSSWADDEIELPSALRTNLSNAPNRSDLPQRDYQNDYRQPREEVPFPTEPPYNAYIENLPYDVTEDDIANAFAGLEIKSTHIFTDFATGKTKGTAIVTFLGPDELTSALETSQNDDRDFSNWRGGGAPARDASRERVSAADGDNQWRKRDESSSNSRFNDSRQGNSGFDNDRPRRNFAPSAADSVDRWRQHNEPVDGGSAISRETSFRSRDREPLVQSEADKVSQWRNKNPISPGGFNRNSDERSSERAPRPTTEADKVSQWRNKQDPTPTSAEPNEDTQESHQESRRREQIASEADKNNQWRKHDEPVVPETPIATENDSSEKPDSAPRDYNRESSNRPDGAPRNYRRESSNRPDDAPRNYRRDSSRSMSKDRTDTYPKKVVWDQEGGDWRKKNDSIPQNDARPRHSTRDGNNRRSQNESRPVRSDPNSWRERTESNSANYRNNRQNDSDNRRNNKPDFSRSANYIKDGNNETKILRRNPDNQQIATNDQSSVVNNEITNKFALLDASGDSHDVVSENEGENAENNDDDGWSTFVPKAKAKKIANNQLKKKK
ncbi:putative RNA-binding protein sce3 [Smittium culicis]|uniref:Putative RNA-binding protein sce3 n=1 Tax=Smittium culicis TaxID=133412 RepID=A0A1R1YE53_9FUNG|nr:putative RNA-binding protein sce3 [Smittium culicis]